MAIWWQKLRDRNINGALFVLTITALVLFIVHRTNGRESAFLPLIYLPIILAVVRCNFEIVVGVGLLITCVYLFLLNPGADMMSFKAEDVVRAMTLNATTIIGGFYARQVQQERERLRHTLDEKDTLLNASQIINAADTLEQAVNSTLLLIRTLVPRLRCAALFLADDAQRFMELASVIGEERSALKFERFSLHGRRTGWQPDDPNPLYLPDVEERRDLRIAALDPRARSAVCVSLRSLKVPIGMLYVSAEQPNAFTEAQVTLLRSFADRIGFPLQKIRVQEGLQGLAFTDGMTGLYNFRYFRNHLEDEIKRSVRYKRPLSLILLDLDNFKAINDRYGHPAGDKLLTAVAGIIRSSVRETDLPARYGGEEFAIVCPETTGADALIVAERIRATIEASRFQLISDESCAVTVSAGLATYPVDAQDEAALILAADNALYHAKHTGKNRVAAAESLVALSPETA